MAENSKIQWPDHTFNPLIGCTKVSDGCKFCYAEEQMDHRYHKVKWGPTGTRVRTVKDNWKKVERWNCTEWVACAACGWRGPSHDLIAGLFRYTCPQCKKIEISPTRQRVFCASLSDVFEDHPAWEPVRRDLVSLIERTPNLDWLLLTKRPQNVMPFLAEAQSLDPVIWLERNSHTWIGTSVENQAAIDARLPIFRSIPASVLFLSCEPLLSALDFTFASDICHCGDLVDDHGYKDGHSPVAMMGSYLDGINWVIAGSESGGHARPCDLAWVRSLRDQCKSLSVPFFVKQLQDPQNPKKLHKELAEFPPDLRIRKYPERACS